MRKFKRLLLRATGPVFVGREHHSSGFKASRVNHTDGYWERAGQEFPRWAGLR